MVQVPFPVRVLRTQYRRAAPATGNLRCIARGAGTTLIPILQVHGRIRSAPHEATA